MEKFLKKLLDYVKGMTLFSKKLKNRFIVNVLEDLERRIREICQIPPEEKIKIVLEDSQWYNLQDLIVFTDKNIYWHIKNAYMKIKEENSEITVKGYGLINNKDLNVVSVFSKTINKIKNIYLVSPDLQIILPVKNIETEQSLSSTFYGYISNHCGGYNPNEVENKNLYKIITADNNYKKIIMQEKKSTIIKIIKRILGTFFKIIICFIFFSFLISSLIEIGVLDLNNLNLFEYIRKILNKRG